MGTIIFLVILLFAIPVSIKNEADVEIKNLKDAFIKEMEAHDVVSF